MKSCRQPLYLKQILICKRFCPAAVTDPVYSGNLFWHEIIILYCLFIIHSPCDSSIKSSGLFHSHHGTAVLDAVSISCDACHIRSAGYHTFGITIGNMGQWLSGNAAHVIAGLTLYPAIVFTAQNGSHFLQPCNAARIAFLRSNHAIIDILPENTLCQECGVCPGVLYACHVTFQVKIIFYSHRSCNTWYIQICTDSPGIYTVRNRCVNAFFRIFLRIILIYTRIVHIQNTIQCIGV